MVATTLAFMEHLDSKDVRYTYKPLEKSELISIGYEGDNMKDMNFMFFFDKDGESVSVKCFSIYQFGANDLARGIVCSNKLNNKYRWIKFYIDEDNEAAASIDAVITSKSTGDVCFELLIRMLDIVDEAYLVYNGTEEI